MSHWLMLIHPQLMLMTKQLNNIMVLKIVSEFDNQHVIYHESTSNTLLNMELDNNVRIKQ